MDIGWDESLATGIKSIDDEHQRLFGYIADLETALSKGKSKEVLTPIFDGLLEYTLFHFGHEEQLFSQYQYANSSQHLALHDLFITNMKALRSKFDSKGNFGVASDLLNFLTQWLIDHILGEDEKYLPLFEEKGVK
ncbi:MAG: hypothetical protein A2508_01750 [Candidatus Lambdaproteobacteria bacterium RIFOXYD12_FULL_49_8]|uniref:Hemerythrin-like domain-containing protein n=1 Tax=Candidatus Lambdaproteobacteria bacterium RIFOXYD2_FULL_50_16 TaxID=1817772 RepID=A0A1F6GFD8_9PROT|nr:MAG: hypothetical protein A2527_00775 [Candidatus Lambdaproteobacteria bacterium RIFOXYD2_FULL_50_16]OGG98201.1 MAG: hypothetical protein A2508_01750 [Candidatus Lambdaproteobacteria bacterium RIFOXYD12_FULL_49_8]